MIATQLDLDAIVFLYTYFSNWADKTVSLPC